MPDTTRCRGWGDGDRIVYQEAFICKWKNLAEIIWTLLSVIGRSEVGSSVANWAALMTSRTPFFHSWVSWLQPIGHTTRQASLVVSGWLYHFQALHPHNNLQRQQHDLLFHLKFRKPLSEAFLMNSHGVVEQNRVTCPCPNQSLVRKWYPRDWPRCEDPPCLWDGTWDTCPHGEGVGAWIT